MVTTRGQLVWMSAFLMLFLVGCSGGPSDMPEVGQVTGTVKLDGSPLAGAVVSFYPTEGGRTANGVTKDDGTYEVIYNSSTKGAKIGKNQVSVSKLSGGEEGGGDETIPAKYNQKTELNFEVKAGDNTYDIDLTSK